MTITSQSADITSSHWSKFHVNIITSSGVMTIFFCRGLTKNPENGNTSIWVLPNIWKLERVRKTKFDLSLSNKMFLNAAKCQSCSFDHFWVIKGKPIEGSRKRMCWNRGSRYGSKSRKNYTERLLLRLFLMCLERVKFEYCSTWEWGKLTLGKERFARGTKGKWKL